MAKRGTNIKAKKKETEEKKFTFGSVFEKSIKEYGQNFRPLLKLILFFVGLPYLIFTLLELLVIRSDSRLLEMLTNPSMITAVGEGTIRIPLYYQALSAVFGMIMIFLMIFVSAALINTSLRKSKFSFEELVKNGNSRYWEFVLFNIVLVIFLMLLFLALIIPGIIFAVYWLFACYVFFDKKQGIKKSLKESRMIVKGKWWKTFGYLLLISLILLMFTLVINIIQLPTFIIYMVNIVNDTSMSFGFFSAYSIIEILAGFIGSLVCTPLGILFFKNFYLGMKDKYDEKMKGKKK